MYFRLTQISEMMIRRMDVIDSWKKLTTEFGKGFDESNLRYMRLFCKAFPICDTLRHELSWSHYRRLLNVDNAEARHWYMNEAVLGVYNRRKMRYYYEIKAI